MAATWNEIGMSLAEVGLAAVVLAGWLAVPMFLVWRHGLTRRAFHGSPSREVSLTGVDLAVAVGYPLMILAMKLGVAGARPADGAGGEGAVPSFDPGATLLLQMVTQGPVVLYFVWRVLMASRVGVAGVEDPSVPPWRVWGDALGRAGLWPRRVGGVGGVGKGGWVMTGVGLLVGIGSTLLVSQTAVTLWQWAGWETQELAHTALEPLTREKSIGRLLWMLVPLVVAAPILEELIFRGFLQTAVLAGVRRWRRGRGLRSGSGSAAGGERWVVIAIASALFAAVHIGSADVVALRRCSCSGSCWVGSTKGRAASGRACGCMRDLICSTSPRRW